MTDDPVREAYAKRAAEYIEVLGAIDHATQEDRDYLLAWAQSVDGRVLDVGCGPGQWTNYFREAGIDVEGVDPVVEFIDDAKIRYPLASYRTGRAERLEVASSTIGGILAWFSLIHTPPDAINEPLHEFARCVRPGGSLAIGFFDGHAGETFAHAVAPAFHWSVGELSERLQRVGFTVIEARTRHDAGVRRQGVVVACRAGS